jgi:hypothetical protein
VILRWARTLLLIKEQEGTSIKFLLSNTVEDNKALCRKAGMKAGRQRQAFDERSWKVSREEQEATIMQRKQHLVLNSGQRPGHRILFYSCYYLRNNNVQ